jgi:galactonate dehydratase
VLTTAVAGLEIALWDLCGQVLGVPVYRLLGGACRAGIPVYANGWFERGPGLDDALAPGDLAPLAVRAREQGFGALKFYPLGYASPGRRMTTSDFAQGIERVTSVREAVGPDVDIMLDVHGMLTPTEALWFADRCEQFQPFWLEEPVPPEDLEGAVLVAGSSRVRIAMGERLYSPTAFLPLLGRRGCAIAQPDPLHVGGLSMFTRISALAAASQIRVAPHNSNGPVALAACVHLAAALPEILTVEYPLDPNAPLRNDLAEFQYMAAGGMIPLPSRPGLGLHLNEDLLQRHLVERVRK